MKKNLKLDPNSIMRRASIIFAHLRKYTVVFYLLLLAIVYGFVLYKVSRLVGAQPSDSDVSAQVQSAATPHVDAATVQQIQALQDNSVSVQSLFDQARNNPFNE